MYQVYWRPQWCTFQTHDVFVLDQHCSRRAVLKTTSHVCWEACVLPVSRHMKHPLDIRLPFRFCAKRQPMWSLWDSYVSHGKWSADVYIIYIIASWRNTLHDFCNCNIAINDKLDTANLDLLQAKLSWDATFAPLASTTTAPSHVHQTKNEVW